MLNETTRLRLGLKLSADQANLSSRSLMTINQYNSMKLILRTFSKYAVWSNSCFPKELPFLQESAVDDRRSYHRN